MNKQTNIKTKNIVTLESSSMYASSSNFNLEKAIKHTLVNDLKYNIAEAFINNEGKKLSVETVFTKTLTPTGKSINIKCEIKINEIIEEN